MQTTAILAELLVIGCSALIWFIPIAAKYFKFDTLKMLKTSNEIIIFVAILYVLGILVNYLSDRFFALCDVKLANKNGGKKKHQLARSKILLSTSDASSYMTTRRSIVRIMRASSFNFFVLSVLIIASLCDPMVQLANFWESLIFLSISVIFFLGYRHTLIGYFKFLVMMNGIIDENKS